MKKISLGFKGPDYGSHSPVAPPEPVTETKTYYPSAYISNAPKELMRMASEGDAMITFKVASRSMNERDGTCSMELEIHSITPKSTNGAMRESKDEAGEAVDEYFK